MAADDVQTMWEIADADPVSGAGPTLNALTNIAALLYRAQLAGIRVPEARWKSVSDFALKILLNPGVTFADIHAALAQVMGGQRGGAGEDHCRCKRSCRRHGPARRRGHQGDCGAGVSGHRFLNRSHGGT